jgi:ssDNA-binding Zn-finger/Zn-ribbon topoisomerase 1
MSERGVERTSRTCPKCGPDVRLEVRTSLVDGRKYLGCERFPECRYMTSYPEDLRMRDSGAPRLPIFDEN